MKKEISKTDITSYNLFRNAEKSTPRKSYLPFQKASNPIIVYSITKTESITIGERKPYLNLSRGIFIYKKPSNKNTQDIKKATPKLHHQNIY